ncbi:MAG: tRNA uridine-5-carboxymethylaminomethyl(34) synthesis GTPase MnmE [Solirubrobacterales bacterium]
MDRDCIAAISTPYGEGGISLIRVSGENALAIADHVFKPLSKESSVTKLPSHSLTLGWVRNASGEVIDQALLGVMRAPRSYTGEDIVEFNCHGGLLLARTCLESLIQSGARLAEPGEFTRRAYANGRLDATQAEAVVELIRARSERALELSVRNLRGMLSRAVDQVTEQLIITNSRIEASIDFGDDVGDPPWDEIGTALKSASQRIDALLAGGRRTRFYRDGASVVIAGKPNVGKSSLLNALVRKDRAIVTEVPGTTRDVIEEYIAINGVPIRIKDTAGIREGADQVEKIGIERAVQAIEEADVVIFMLDAESGITEEDQDVRSLLLSRPALVLVNKLDIENHRITTDDLDRMFPEHTVCWISAQEEQGIQSVEEGILELLFRESANPDGEDLMVNLRQETLLKQAGDHIQAALDSIQAQMPMDCVAVDTWGAVESLEELTGRRIREDIIDRIFKDFCIGK